MNSKIKNLTRRRDKILKEVNHNDNERHTQALEIASSITKKIQDIQRVCHNCNKIEARANWHLQGEMVNKYWCTKGKEKKGCDTIMELHKSMSNPTSYTTSSKGVVNEMATYHETVQEKDLDTPEPQRETAMNSALQDLPKIENNEKIPLQEQLTYTEIELAIKHSPNQKAPSLNSIPSNLYKKLHQ